MGCDGCTACCDILTIEAIGKKAHTKCKYCDGSKCTIYSERPDVCKNFTCAYLAGNWRIELRPDQCGVMIYNDSVKGYQALMFVEPNQVDPLIMDQINFMEKRYRIKIHGIDARNKNGTN